MASYNKFQDFAEQLAKGKHDFSAHAFKVALTNTAPVLGDSQSGPWRMNSAYTTLIAILSLSAIWIWGLAIYTLFSPL